MERTVTEQSPPQPPRTKPPLYSFGRPWPEFNDGLFYTDVVKCSTSSAPTLIDFYASNYKSSAPIDGWLHRIRNGQITVDGEVVKDPNSILRDGSKVVYHRLPWKEPSTPYLLEVVYEDDDIVVINKPSGLQVLPGGLFQQRTVLTQLQWREWRVTTSSHCTEEGASQAHPVPVHRLGRGTSGLLLCAKTKTAKVKLASYFAEGTANARSDRAESEFCNTRQISKFYRALVTGIIEHDEVIITQPIGLVKYAGVAQGLYVASPTGKSAMSKVRVLDRDTQRNETLVQVEIQSGRPHQIRIHLSYVGHPLLGDPLYCKGGTPNIYTADYSNGSFAEDGGYEKPVQPVPGDCGYHLHAHWLVLSHPTSHERISLVARLPSLLQTEAERS